MAKLSDRTGDVVATTDQNADGRVDQKDDRVAARRVATDDAATTDRSTTYRSPLVDDGEVGRAQVDAELSARRRLEQRTATATKAATTTMPVVDTDEVVLKGPRPRASLTATLALVLGVVAAVLVLTGLLAGPGVAAGLIAACIGLGGVAATSRRHVAGKSDAFLGIALGLASVVLGVLALTGNLSWLTGDTNMVGQVRDWFAAQIPWLLP
jgi:hypothetical protein